MSNTCEHGLIWGIDTCVPSKELQAEWEAKRPRKPLTLARWRYGRDLLRKWNEEE